MAKHDDAPTHICGRPVAPDWTFSISRVSNHRWRQTIRRYADRRPARPLPLSEGERALWLRGLVPGDICTVALTYRNRRGETVDQYGHDTPVPARLIAWRTPEKVWLMVYPPRRWKGWADTEAGSLHKPFLYLANVSDVVTDNTMVRWVHIPPPLPEWATGWPNPYQPVTLQIPLQCKYPVV